MPSGRGNSAIGPPKAANLTQRVSLLWAAQRLVVKAGESDSTDPNAAGGPPPAREWVRLKLRQNSQAVEPLIARELTTLDLLSNLPR